MVVPDSPSANLPGLIRDLLRKRGLSDDANIQEFLNPSYDTGLADPYLMTDMEAAVSRIVDAIKRKEKVAVYGDYDIDGIASTAMLLEVLQAHGLEPIAYIPDRYEEGYGLHQKALAQLKDQGVDLVISVDCGITSVAEAQWARENGLDLVITDHHEVPEELPQAVAVINPKRPDDEYPWKDLAGVGVTFALVRALQQRTEIPQKGHEKWLLDLAALGTVCDVMPLMGENRVLVYYGLKVLRKTRRVGLVALAQSAGIDLNQTKAYQLGFVFGPRLNAAGRLEHANYALELLVTKDPIEAQALAFQLEEMNHQRQLEQERITNEADQMAEGYRDDSVLVLADPGWPHGVVGIVASKLSEKWGKPTLVLQILEDSAKGSGRSAGGYNLIEGLRANEDIFSRLGGHHFAAGFTLPIDNIDALRTSINDHYDSVKESLPSSKRAREAEIEVDSTDDINWAIIDALDMLEPCGNGNSQPTFGISKLKILNTGTVGKNRQHVKMRLATETGTIFEAIGFGLAEKYPNLKGGQIVDVVCYLQKNQWGEKTSLQLTLLSIQ